MKKILITITTLVLTLFGAQTVMAYTLASTNALNQASNAPGRPGQLAPHVVQTTASVGSVTLTFKNPSVVLACFERRIDGQVAYHNNVQTNHFFPALAAEGEKVYPYFCMAAGAADRVETYSASSTVEIRHAFGPENDWYFDWTTFNVLPNPDLDGDGVLNENDLCADTEVDGAWDSDKGWGTNRWQVMDESEFGWYQNKPAKKGSTVATYAYDMAYTYGCNGHQIIDRLTAELNENSMNGHRKFGLSSSVLEEFHWDMADGILDGIYLMDEVDVPGTSSIGVITSYATENDVNYKLEASGTYRFANWGEYGIADAKYNYRSAAYNGGIAGWVDGSTWSSPYQYYLQVKTDTSGINWIEGWNSAHIYTASFAGDGSPIHFKVMDDAYGDNSGSIHVKIFADL